MLTLATITPAQAEIFAAPQGEGPSAGQVCAFIRLSRCNLACVWCDTAYTWRFTGDTRPHTDNILYSRATNQISLSTAEAAAQIAALNQTRLVITGGEPLLQSAALARMIALLPPHHIEIETNGTTAATPALDAQIHQYNVSPKLAHSGNAASLALPPARLSAYAADPRAWFKFVIAAPNDVTEVLAISATYNIPHHRIYLMPEGRSSAALNAKMPWLGDICSKHGFHISDRLHIHSHGDTRGT
ncbi:MAG: hypothetical protein RLY97_1412 [Pseudomonadota bacterium]